MLAFFKNLIRNKSGQRAPQVEIRKHDSISDSVTSQQHYQHRAPTSTSTSTSTGQGSQSSSSRSLNRLQNRNQRNEQIARYLSKTRTVTEEYKELYQQKCPPTLPLFYPDRDMQPPLSTVIPQWSGRYGQIYIYKIPSAQVAVKVFHYEYQKQQKLHLEEQFMTKMDILCGLECSYLVKYMQASVIPGQRAILMEYVDHNLHTFIHDVVRSDHIMNRTILRLTKSMANGLKYLHSQNIVHGDLRPSSVLISKDGLCKISTYGLSACVKNFRLGRISHATELAYTAPEIFNNTGVSYPTDIWALGIILFEMATRTKPWKGNGPGQIAMAICTNQLPEIPSYVNKDIRKLILSCCNQQPNNRPTANYIVDTCQNLLQSMS